MTTTIDLPSHFNVAEHFLNLNLGGEREDHPYLICGDDRLTYRELYMAKTFCSRILERQSYVASKTISSSGSLGGGRQTEL